MEERIRLARRIDINLLVAPEIVDPTAIISRDLSTFTSLKTISGIDGSSDITCMILLGSQKLKTYIRLPTEDTMIPRAESE